MKIVEKPWGYQEFFIDEKGFSVRKLVLYKNHRYSLQVHEKKKEQFIVINGYPLVRINDTERIFYPNETFVIEPGVVHRISAIISEVWLLEIMWGFEEDITRLSDDYGRINEQKE